MPRSDAVPWLDDEERAAWFSFMSVLTALPGALDAQLRRDAGLSHFDYQILAALSMTKAPRMPMSAIAEATETSLSRLSHACKRLEAKGWLRRHPDPNDGRVTLAELTDAGYAKVAGAAAGHVRTVRALVFDPLTKAQIKQLAQITGRVSAALGGPKPALRDLRS